MSAVPAVLAIDQGTTGSTALVVAKDGRILSKTYSEFTQHFPEPGWVEHDAQEIWDVTRAVSREALEVAGSEARVESIGITNQRETVVLWDRETLEPVHRAIVWQDRRTATICQELKDLLATHLGPIAGIVFDGALSSAGDFCATPEGTMEFIEKLADDIDDPAEQAEFRDKANTALARVLAEK